MKRYISLLCLLSLFALLSGCTTSPGYGGVAQAAKPYNVRDFGAKGDGATKDTAALQKALDTCAVNGGGDVLIPAGKYLIGSVQIGYRTILRLEKDSIIAGSPDSADYPMIDIRWEGRGQPGRVNTSMIGSLRSAATLGAPSPWP